jgi:hypothetical protein
MYSKRSNQVRLTLDEFEPRITPSRFSHAVHHVAQQVHHIEQKVVQEVHHVEDQAKNVLAKVEALAATGLDEIRKIIGPQIKFTGDDYDAVRAQFQNQYGPANVYFSSRGWVDFAGADRLALNVVAGIVSHGATVPATVADIEAHVKAEANAAGRWLANKALSRVAQNTIQQTLAAAIRGQKSYVNSYFALKTHTVYYNYEVSYLGIKTHIRIPHNSFAIIWKFR